MTFMTADQAKVLSDVANLNIEVYKPRLAKLIEENAKQGNTAVITVFPKHLPLEDIRALSAELTELGYNVRFEVLEFYYSFNVYWL
ncbi:MULTISPECIES: hypothetical protein [Acinetobacter]|uniref:Uncharacterized protein n=1 Tax=Acinetobacter pseudolwoffii TaxID=2053287 RepID=A0A2H9UNW3_9GAMM|nr:MULTISPECIES: hypothetical protein [Acinetobacter]ENW25030.1 hypothetical protein F925_01698 [Acinetobacter lwoffii NCTC 5866 = CIP 64.10 = NIPH 512]NLZ86147.1 hypothetical protein [Gammaproteobacteria bacterium]MCO8090095.1 hypothetical protein [Acinetobacter pseudolwoffii]MCP0910887.1 hypothetical protein [Acinetobacter pseudolwoffii]MDH5818753.1 hypothetical protein [Acinetobacter pseudolwoffii]